MLRVKIAVFPILFLLSIPYNFTVYGQQVRPTSTTTVPTPVTTPTATTIVATIQAPPQSGLDAGVAAIVAAALSTVIGGFLGFASSYYTNKQSQQQARSLASLPRQAEAIEYVSLVLFKSLAGDFEDRGAWDRYITNCLWLPPTERAICLDVLADRRNQDKLRRAQKAVLDLFDKLIQGDRA